mmetsp:Transcript_27056/g.58737  ORF Transcript_27056/g.58737 Transcript_27056/m.58737 type:complete len:85 (+) Transcript_27056:64-318(+)
MSAVPRPDTITAPTSQLWSHCPGAAWSVAPRYLFPAVSPVALCRHRSVGPPAVRRFCRLLRLPNSHADAYLGDAVVRLWGDGGS